MQSAVAMTAPAPAPFLSDVAEGPEGAEAWWVTSADGTRLRLGIWPAGEKGTVLLFPGRTEYLEKYGRVAADLAAAGFGMVAFDWRGQGLADRPQHRRDMGHVVSFDEYRQDVEAFRTALDTLGVAGPFHIVAHSMGGAIGLRALHDGLPVRGAAFTGPMWGIQMTPFLKSIAGIVLGLAGPLGFGTTFAPTTGPWQPMEFAENPLTTDRAQFDYMSRQMEEHPELVLGGPSVLWVKAALEETRALMAMPAPDVPALTIFGSSESIVEVPAIRTRMRTWPNGRLLELSGARHEVLMEAPELRRRSLDAIIAHFDTNA
ncbi:alpha/beta hydrolase [Roseibacterium sp. SDUM158016]|uniref:alpha/beta fold hydrolase n=1 Tax=Roseicyclus sediminis TaxID=2980997 RepID=UPI0021D3382D|nr:alpha/beta hydrolase [Roseibacterium sp. SDUM158016]MCU4653642.1 alpha/beta hydrolase [Roseibacterium sp. SDUM158016]